MLPDETDVSLLESVGCFSLGTYDPWRSLDRAEAEHDACRRFVGPALATATHARLYPSRLFAANRRQRPAFLLPRRGYFEFDLRRECVVGHEDFWRAGASGGEYLRGTVVVILSSSTRLDVLLKDCVLYGIPSSRHQILKGSSVAAIRFAEECSRQGQRSCIFSASNGVEHVDIFSPRTMLVQDYVVAFETANRPRWRMPDA